MPTDNSRREYLKLVAAGASTALAGCASLTPPGGTPNDPDGQDDPVKIDDWQYDPEETNGNSSSGFSLGSAQPTGMTAQTSADSAESIGLAAGGAKDIATFRRNIEEGYLPQPESLAYEGLFYNYYFDTGSEGTCSSPFCPSYAPAVTTDPLSDETERYLTVGLNSGIEASSFARKQLNLVVVLDVSGSMSSAFSDYYYDRYGNKHTPEGDTDTPKIEVARQALTSLTEQLRPEDRLGVVLYSSDSSVAKPLRKVEQTDMDAIRGHMQEDIVAGGGTNLDAGLTDATELLSEYSGADQTTTENRMIVLTDAMPNLGTTSSDGLTSDLSDNAKQNLYTTFIGIGVDFNTELVDSITSIRGANYYGVHSTDEFERRLSDGFKYMVTPLVFDLSLELDADGYEIEQVYGSTAAEESTGEIMRVNTLFASPTEDGQTRGGVVLVQVDKTADDARMELRASWENRQGIAQETTTTIQFPADGPEYFETSGVRKAVLLSRYADLLKNWIIAEREPTLEPTDEGIGVPPEQPPLGEWEQQSDPLTVSDQYEQRLRTFREYFETEADTIGDESLDQEAEMLRQILSTAEE
jgi:Ca-activated chloride channel family protein